MQNGSFKIRNAVIPILAVNILFFILQNIVPGFEESLILIGSKALTEPWRLVTSMFLHGGFYHILVNMYMLLIFGQLLEQQIGTKRFLTLYFVSGMLASLLSAAFYGPNLHALGASGAIMGIMGTLVILMPGLRLLLFFIIPTPLWMIGILYIFLDFFGVLYPSGIGNVAHLVGMFFGLGYGKYLKKEAAKFHKKFSKKKHLDEFDADEYLRTGRI
jgi:uncharacterized protein